MNTEKDIVLHHEHTIPSALQIGDIFERDGELYLLIHVYSEDAFYLVNIYTGFVWNDPESDIAECFAGKGHEFTKIKKVKIEAEA